jgi:ubiquinone/menaquinone biosynthesis C-methylase UbiE
MDLVDEAEAYAAADFADVNIAFAERVLKLADNFKTARVVDLGCGPADIAIRIALARAEWRIDAVDASPAMLDIARRAVSSYHAARNLTLCLADAKNTGLSSGGYDVIFSNSLLHHLPDPLPLWTEMKRLARPGAVLFVRDLHRPATAQAARRIVGHYAGGETKLLQEEFYRSLLAAFTIDEVRGQLAEARLAHLAVETSSDRHLDVHGRVTA